MYEVIEIWNHCMGSVMKFPDLGNAIWCANDAIGRFIENHGCEDFGYAREDNLVAFAIGDKDDYFLYIKEV